MSGGQMKLIVKKTSRMKTIIWMMSVRLMFTLVSRCECCEAPVARPKPRRAPQIRLWRRASMPRGRPQGGQERIGEHEEQRKADADHRDRIEQARDDEHSDEQRGCELRLARHAFEEATPEDAEADGRAERAHAEDETDGDCGHGLNLCDTFHFLSLRMKT